MHRAAKRPSGAGLDAYVTFIENGPLIVAREALEYDVLIGHKHSCPQVGHPVSRKAAAQQSAEGGLDIERRDRAPPFQTAVGGKHVIQ